MLRDHEYTQFFAKYIALCLLHDHDRSINDIIKVYGKSGMETMEYLDEFHIFGALDDMVKDGWVEKYAQKDEDEINIIHYHLTDEGRFFIGPYRTKLRDFYKRLIQFYDADEYYRPN